MALMSKTPEEWLHEVSPEKARGIFKLFLGYAPGVGKTYNMLSEAIRRASRGEDVIVGVVESHGRKRLPNWPASSIASHLESSNTKAQLLTRWTWTRFLLANPR